MTLFYDVGITVEGAGGAVKQMVEVTWSGTEQWPAMCPGPWGQATGARRRLRAGVRCHACCGRCYPGRFPDRGCARSRSDLSWLKITGSGSSRPTDLGFRAAAVVGLRPTGHNSAVAADDDGTGAFRGASFTGADFTGANFRDCDLRQVKITDSWLVDLSLSGLVGKLVVNDVDVTALVEGELDRRHPERVQLRGKRTAGDYRAMWDAIERLWAGTAARAGRLPEPGTGMPAAARARVLAGSTLGRPLPGRGHEGGVRAPPLRGPRPRGPGSGPRRRGSTP
jgi:hypothetical protein